MMKQWYVLRAKPKKEKSASALLASEGIEVYVPWLTTRVRRDRPPRIDPLFPGYFFGRLDARLAEVSLANRTAGVLYVLGNGDEPLSVPDDLILAIQRRLGKGSCLPELPKFHQGDQVVITNGPFEGFEAVFDAYLSPTGRVRVLIQTLRRFYRAQVHVEKIRRLDQVVKSVAS